MSPALAVAAPVVAVAYSGGRDSTALLHAAAKAASEQGGRVVALHVHHGLQPRADEWLAHCQRQCTAWRRRGWPIEFAHTHLALRPRKGESVEAVARTARYRALRDMALAHGANVVLLAHHRRDQAETFLLQALRGAGVAGLAGMPAVAERSGITWMRPWLGHPREAVEAYVRRHRLRYIDDDSNDDPRYARNRLRLQVWPALTQAFAHAETSLADAGAWARDASVCLAELAAIDLAVVATDAGLRIEPWVQLGPARARNALRAWVHQVSGHALPASWVDRLWSEAPQARSARWELPGGQLRSYRGVLSYAPARGDQAAPGARDTALSITRAGRHRLAGWGGVVRAQRCAAGGVPLALLSQLREAERAGGEQFQSGPGRPARSLKKQFQAAATPLWARQGPLLYAGERLVFVPGLGLDARVLARGGEPQVLLHWEPDAQA